MSQSTAQYLSALIDKYTPSATEFDAARTHRAGIEVRLNARLGVHEMFETGSLKHGTGVAGFSDADFIASLKGERPNSTTALNRVKEALQDKYPSTTIQVRRPAVVCRFANGTETVEVVPAYAADTGYWIPDPTGGWMKTHPKSHNEYVNDVNKKYSGATKRLVRLAKTWKYKRNVPLSSFYLEMRAAKYLDGESYVDLVQDLYFLLNHLEDVDLAPMNDPTGLGSRFNAYSSDSSGTDAISKLSRAVTRARKAKDYGKNGEHSLAIDQLKLLFNQ